jgi:hypothetical protein
MPAVNPPPQPSDAERHESSILTAFQALGAAVPPPELRARVLAAAEPGHGSPLRLAGLAGVAAAAALLLGVGLQVFARAANTASEPGALRLAVVDDPDLPLLASLEPVGSLGTGSEALPRAGR